LSGRIGNPANRSLEQGLKIIMAKKLVTVPVTVVAPVVTAPVAKAVVPIPAVPVIVLSCYHQSLCEGADALRDSTLSARAVFALIIKAEHGDTSPTHGQCRDDRAAFAIHDKARGLKNARYSILSYNAAVVSLYGKLPVSTDPEAVRLAAKRLADKVAQGNAPAAKGAPAGDTHVSHVNSPNEAIEQALTRIGIDKVLAALSRMLAVDASTALQSKAIAAIADQLKAA
jgi:hypothetical protein